MTSIAAACPAQHESIDEIPPAADRARILLGESATLLDGGLRVTFLEMQRGGSFADVRLELVAGGQSVTDEVTATRQTDYSNPARIAGYTVRIEGFPGVDSVTVVAWAGGGPE